MSPNNEKAFIPSSISELTEITLTHEQAQSLRLEYSGLNYQYTDNTQYAMKMEGIDKDWQFVGNQHQVRFSNLPSGRYILKIKASKDGIHWDETGQKDLAIRRPSSGALAGSIFSLCTTLPINHLRRIQIYQNAYHPAHATENGA